MEAIVAIITAAIVGGTAVFCYTMYQRAALNP